jgi:hypothetical protein
MYFLQGELLLVEIEGEPKPDGGPDVRALSAHPADETDLGTDGGLRAQGQYIKTGAEIVAPVVGSRVVVPPSVMRDSSAEPRPGAAILSLDGLQYKAYCYHKVTLQRKARPYGRSRRFKWKSANGDLWTSIYPT